MLMLWIFLSALASHSGLPHSFAPLASAMNSRDREKLECSRAAFIVAVASHAAEDRHPPGHVCDKHNRGSERGRHAADQRVAVGDMGNLVREHAFEFFLIQCSEKPLSHGYRRMV